MLNNFLTGFQATIIPESVKKFASAITTVKPETKAFHAGLLKSIGWIKASDTNSFSSKIFYLAFADTYAKKTLFMTCPVYYFDDKYIDSIILLNLICFSQISFL